MKPQLVRLALAMMFIVSACGDDHSGVLDPEVNTAVQPVLPGDVDRLKHNMLGFLYAESNSVKRSDGTYASGGLFLSTDNGISWEKCYMYWIRHHEISISPNNTIYMGKYARTSYLLPNSRRTPGSISDSQDFGRTWSTIEWDCVYSNFHVCADRNNTVYLYYSADVRYTYRSTDGGDSWDSNTTDIGPSPSYFLNNILNHTELIADLESNLYLGGFRSDDQGASWERLPFLASTTTGNNLCFDLNNMSYFVSPGEYWRSLDNGDSWEDCSSKLPTNAAQCICISRSGDLFIGTTNGKVLISSDRGESWTYSSLHLDPDCAISTIVCTDSKTLFLSYTGNSVGMMRSTDRGQTWEDLYRHE